MNPAAVKTTENPTKNTEANLVPLKSSDAGPNGARVVLIGVKSGDNAFNLMSNLLLNMGNKKVKEMKYLALLTTLSKMGRAWRVESLKITV